MTPYFTGLVLFFGLHLFTGIRDRTPEKDIRARMGYGLYMGLYSVLSLLGLALIIYGYAETRGLGYLYTPPIWAKHLNLLIMVPALILLVASQLPTGHLKKWTRHPMLVAVKLWALGHLLANGELNSVLLFGTFLFYAIIDRILVKRRGDNGPGADVQVQTLMDIVSVVLGLALWVGLAVWLHPILFGVPALG